MIGRGKSSSHHVHNMSQNTAVNNCPVNHLPFGHPSILHLLRLAPCALQVPDSSTAPRVGQPGTVHCPNGRLAAVVQVSGCDAPLPLGLGLSFKSVFIVVGK